MKHVMNVIHTYWQGKFIGYLTNPLQDFEQTNKFGSELAFPFESHDISLESHSNKDLIYSGKL